jgi:hypothetical protein
MLFLIACEKWFCVVVFCFEKHVGKWFRMVLEVGKKKTNVLVWFWFENGN